MDKLSNKLRLVRSQSMGVGMSGAGGGISGAAAAARRTPAGSSSSSGQEGRPASIVLLDERRLEMVIQPRLYAGELLDLVASHCGLREKEYFGLAVADESGHFTWLQLERRVLDHELPRRPASLAVHFLVKFFLESIAHLADNRTIELFYLQARGLVFRGTLEAEADIVFQLAALALQSAQGDPPQEEAAARALIRKSAVLPAAVLKEHPSAHCEDRVLEHWQKTRGQTRGQAVVNYMSIVESMPTYGVHYFEVLDKRQTAWWLGLSCRGIAQYAHADRRTPVRVFPWRQLENLYFRDKKFSIEVHDARRVVQTLSSVNLYEDALRLDSSSNKDDALVDAIADSTTQVSVSRRTLDPGTIHVYVWFGRTQALTKCIWQSAISQHQFYLDRKQARARHQQPPRSLKEIARNLTRSSASLSSASSLSNLSHSGSTHSLAVAGATALSTAVTEEQRQKEDSEETKRARMEMVSALKARREALDAKLKEKTRQLKELCVKEGELTGELPPETPLAPGEPAPTIRRRVGTEFALSEDLLRKPTSGSSTSEGELLAALELELEIQSKITSAALKLASDAAAPKSVRKQRKVSYQQSQRKLKEIEAKLNALKYFGASSNNNSKQQQPRRKQSRPEGITRSESARGVGDELLRKGMSVPDLEAAAYREEEAATLRRIGNDGDCDEDETDGLSPRSCPASPRKHPQGGGNKRSHDSVSLDNANSPHR